MTYWRSWSQPFFTGTVGSSVTTGLGSIFDVSLAGRGYMLDMAAQGADAYGFQSLPLLQRYYAASQQDVNIGERSLNPEDYWRRSADSFHLGSGQTFFDHPESDEQRYRASKGIDPWTKGEFTLLNDTFARTPSSNTNLTLAVAGSYLYFLDGNALQYLTDVSFGSTTETTVTDAGPSDPLSSPTSMTSDGYTVWVADGTRVNYTTRGNATFDKYHTSDHVATLVRSVKGRLLTAKDNILYVHAGAAGSSVATALLTHPNSDWEWTDIVGGPAAIYFSGFAGDKSMIYKTQVVADGTSLSVPAVAAELPDGEIVRSMQEYLGVLLIGTDQGVRIASTADDGSLQLAGLISTAATYCFEPQDRFVWFGWTNYDADSTGLGRIDLSVFNSAQVITPAYASDLMATTQGVVSSVVTFGDKRIFTVQGHGIYAEDTTNKVTTGEWFSGWMNFGLAYAKSAIKMSTSWRAGVGSFIVALATGGVEDYTNLGGSVTTTNVGGNTALPAGQVSADEFELRFTLTRGSLDTTTAPVISRLTLLANPAPPRRIKITAPLLLHQSVQLRGGRSHTFDPTFERAQLTSLLQSNQIVTYAEVGGSYSVTVDDFHWVPYEPTGSRPTTWDGTMVVELKEQT